MVEEKKFANLLGLIEKSSAKVQCIKEVVEQKKYDFKLENIEFESIVDKIDKILRSKKYEEIDVFFNDLNKDISARVDFLSEYYHNLDSNLVKIHNVAKHIDESNLSFVGELADIIGTFLYKVKILQEIAVELNSKVSGFSGDNISVFLKSLRVECNEFDEEFSQVLGELRKNAQKTGELTQKLIMVGQDIEIQEELFAIDINLNALMSAVAIFDEKYKDIGATLLDSGVYQEFKSKVDSIAESTKVLGERVKKFADVFDGKDALNFQIDEIDAKIEEIKASIQDASDSDDANAQLKSLDESIKAQMNTLGDSLQEHEAKVLKELRGEVLSVEDQISALEKTFTEILKDIESQSNEQEFESLKAQISAVEEVLKEVNANLVEQQKTLIEDLKVDVSPIEDKIAEFEKMTASTMGTQSALIDEVKDYVSTFDEKLDAVEASLKSSQLDSFEAIKGQVSSFDEKLDAVEISIKGSQAADFEGIKDQVSVLDLKIEELNSLIESVNSSEFAELKTIVGSLDSTAKFDELREALTQLASRGQASSESNAAKVAELRKAVDGIDFSDVKKEVTTINADLAILLDELKNSTATTGRNFEVLRDYLKKNNLNEIKNRMLEHEEILKHGFSHGAKQEDIQGFVEGMDYILQKFDMLSSFIESCDDFFLIKDQFVGLDKKVVEIKKGIDKIDGAADLKKFIAAHQEKIRILIEALDNTEKIVDIKNHSEALFAETTQIREIVENLEKMINDIGLDEFQEAIIELHHTTSGVKDSLDGLGEKLDSSAQKSDLNEISDLIKGLQVILEKRPDDILKTSDITSLEQSVKKSCDSQLLGLSDLAERLNAKLNEQLGDDFKQGFSDDLDYKLAQKLDGIVRQQDFAEIKQAIKELHQESIDSVQSVMKRSDLDDIGRLVSEATQTQEATLYQVKDQLSEYLSQSFNDNLECRLEDKLSEKLANAVAIEDVSSLKQAVIELHQESLERASFNCSKIEELLIALQETASHSVTRAELEAFENTLQGIRDEITDGLQNTASRDEVENVEYLIRESNKIQEAALSSIRGDISSQLSEQLGDSFKQNFAENLEAKLEDQLNEKLGGITRYQDLDEIKQALKEIYDEAIRNSLSKADIENVEGFIRDISYLLEERLDGIVQRSDVDGVNHNLQKLQEEISSKVQQSVLDIGDVQRLVQESGQESKAHLDSLKDEISSHLSEQLNYQIGERLENTFSERLSGIVREDQLHSLKQLVMELHQSSTNSMKEAISAIDFEELSSGVQESLSDFAQKAVSRADIDEVENLIRKAIQANQTSLYSVKDELSAQLLERFGDSFKQDLANSFNGNLEEKLAAMVGQDQVSDLAELIREFHQESLQRAQGNISKVEIGEFFEGVNKHIDGVAQKLFEKADAQDLLNDAQEYLDKVTNNLLVKSDIEELDYLVREGTQTQAANIYNVKDELIKYMNEQILERFAQSLSSDLESKFVQRLDAKFSDVASKEDILSAAQVIKELYQESLNSIQQSVTKSDLMSVRNDIIQSGQNYASAEDIQLIKDAISETAQSNHSDLYSVKDELSSNLSMSIDEKLQAVARQADVDGLKDLMHQKGEYFENLLSVLDNSSEIAEIKQAVLSTSDIDELQRLGEKLELLLQQQAEAKEVLVGLDDSEWQQNVVDALNTLSDSQNKSSQSMKDISMSLEARLNSKLSADEFKQISEALKVNQDEIKSSLEELNEKDFSEDLNQVSSLIEEKFEIVEVVKQNLQEGMQEILKKEDIIDIVKNVDDIQFAVKETLEDNSLIKEDIAAVDNKIKDLRGLVEFLNNKQDFQSINQALVDLRGEQADTKEAISGLVNVDDFGQLGSLINENYNEIRAVFESLEPNKQADELQAILDGLRKDQESMRSVIADFEDNVDERALRLIDEKMDASEAAIKEYIDALQAKGDLSNIQEQLNSLTQDVVVQIMQVFDNISFEQETQELKDYIEESEANVKNVLVGLKASLERLLDSPQPIYIDELKAEIDKVAHGIVALAQNVDNIGPEVSEYINTIGNIQNSLESLAMTGDVVKVLEQEVGGINVDIGEILKLLKDVAKQSELVYTLEDAEADFAKVSIALEDVLKNQFDQQEIVKKDDLKGRIDNVNLSISNISEDLSSFVSDYRSFAEKVVDTVENLEGVTSHIANIDSINSEYKHGVNESFKALKNDLGAISTRVNIVSSDVEKISGLSDKLLAMSASNKAELSTDLQQMKKVIDDSDISKLQESLSTIIFSLNSFIDDFEKKYSGIGEQSKDASDEILRVSTEGKEICENIKSSMIYIAEWVNSSGQTFSSLQSSIDSFRADFDDKIQDLQSIDDIKNVLAGLGASLTNQIDSSLPAQFANLMESDLLPSINKILDEKIVPAPVTQQQPDIGPMISQQISQESSALAVAINELEQRMLAKIMESSGASVSDVSVDLSSVTDAIGANSQVLLKSIEDYQKYSASNLEVLKTRLNQGVSESQEQLSQQFDDYKKDVDSKISLISQKMDSQDAKLESLHQKLDMFISQVSKVQNVDLGEHVVALEGKMGSLDENIKKIVSFVEED